jgi:hypothetical protein
MAHYIRQGWDYVAAGGAMSAPWWFTDMNFILQTTLALAGLVYMTLKIVYIIKNKGKD